jgi:hypothetical protein
VVLPNFTATTMTAILKHDNPTFSHKSQWSPRKYSEAFVDWLIEQYTSDPRFFQKAREACRPRPA